MQDSWIIFQTRSEESNILIPLRALPAMCLIWAGRKRCLREIQDAGAAGKLHGDGLYCIYGREGGAGVNRIGWKGIGCN